MARARVVIIGGGFAGVATARELERAGKSEVDVTLVSRQNFMLFTPMLPEVAAGSIDAQDIMQPLRTAGRDRRNAGGSSRFELGEAIGVDVARRTVTVRNPVTHDSKLLEYDELVLAVGATESTMGVPGVEKFAVPLKTIEEAQMVRSRVVGALEAAATTSDLAARDRLLRFVVIGGDFTGVELAGELLAFLHAILGYYPSIDRAKVEVVVLESGARLLGHLPDKFGKYAAAALSKRGARLRLNEEVSAIDGRGVELKSGERIASGTVIWAAGEKPSPLADVIGLKTNKRGAIETGADFAVSGALARVGIGRLRCRSKAEGRDLCAARANRAARRTAAGAKYHRADTRPIDRQFLVRGARADGVARRSRGRRRASRRSDGHRLCCMAAVANLLFRAPSRLAP